MIYRILGYLVLNFTALGIGGLFTRDGVTSEWYSQLSKAPWTPPGWAFGMAWTAIMVCFSIYLAYLWPRTPNKKLLVSLFVLQWIFNVVWNPIFFHFHLVGIGLIVISILMILIGFILFKFWNDMKWNSIFILPYFIWLIIATSLNTYILLYNL